MMVMRAFASLVPAAVGARWIVWAWRYDGKTCTCTTWTGFCSAVAMDDAKIPSLLSGPLLGHLGRGRGQPSYAGVAGSAPTGTRAVSEAKSSSTVVPELCRRTASLAIPWQI